MNSAELWDHANTRPLLKSNYFYKLITNRRWKSSKSEISLSNNIKHLWTTLIKDVPIHLQRKLQNIKEV